MALKIRNERKDFALYLKQGLELRGLCKWQSIEDRYTIGIPDIFYSIRRKVNGTVHRSNGWVETKYLSKWPMGGSPVKMRKLTAQQRSFIHDVGEKGGNTWLFLAVREDFVLIPRQQIWEVGELSKAELLGVAAASWSGGIDWSELADLLAIGN